MTWQTTTTSITINGSSTMGAGTALNRALATTPSGVTQSGFYVRTHIQNGVGAGTYNAFATGSFGKQSPYIIAVSFVPTGGSVPSLATTFDDSQYLFVDDIPNTWDRHTINTAGSPTYQDQYSWLHVRSGRMQINTAVTGSYYLHIFNASASSQATSWRCTFRGSYAAIV